MQRTYRLLFLAFTAVLSFEASSQCVQTVNFNDWSKTGDSTYAGSGWTLQSGGSQILSTDNTDYPRMYMGPDTLINVRITGTFRVETTSDDDYIGFVFGFKETWDHTWYGSNTMDHEYYLFEWKQNNQTYATYTALEGFSLNKVDGVFYRTLADVFPSFWSHANSTRFQVLQTSFSTTSGWVPFTYYDFELLYTPTRAVIMIDSDTIFDQGGCFPPGLFGFYNYSQAYARYMNFNYELYIDFDIEEQDICFGDTARFVLVDTGSCYNANTFTNLDTFYWDLGDGTVTSDTNPVHVYALPGVYDVMLIGQDINGCSDTMTKGVYIHGDPDALVSLENVCRGDTAYFGDSTSLPFGSLTTWNWDFGDGSGTSTQQHPAHYYNQSGIYTVVLMAYDNAGCIGTDTTQIEIYPPPIPQFSVTGVCDGTPVPMDDSSQASLGAITALAWDVQNNGTTDYSSSSVSHLYPEAGLYAIELKVTDSLGCRDSLVQLAEVYPMPEADFEAYHVCFGEPTVFIDSSSVSVGSISDWEWIFSDGGTSQNSAPVHTYANPGNYEVQLVVTTNEGCEDSYSKFTTVYELPVAQFAAPPQCQNLPVDFIQSSVPGDGFLQDFHWNFGDGNTSASATPLQAYNQPGAFQVVLEVGSNYGCTDTAIGSVRIYPEPVAGFSWGNNVCLGDSLPLYDASLIAQITPGGDSLAEWLWNVNGLEISNDPDTKYKSGISQNIDVQLYVWSNHGCVDSAQNKAQVHPLPDASFTADIGCAGHPTKFTDISEIKWGLVSGWHWTMDGQPVSEEQHPEFIFETPGNHEVNLVAVSNKGCKDSITVEVMVPETPFADFKVMPDIGCSPLNVSLLNLSHISNGELTYHWTVNGSYLSSEANFVHEFTNDTLVPVPYTIGLKTTSGEGCVTQVTKENVVWVLPAPKAAFKIPGRDVTMFYPVVSFENTSERSIRWRWAFGDGKTSTAFAPVHEYTSSGDHTIELTAWNEYNCPDTIISYLHIEPVTTLYVPLAFTPNGDGMNDVWGVKGQLEDRRYKLRVWNRWGDLVLETTDLNTTWDGRMPDNNMAPGGMYTYEIAYYTSDGQYKELYGHFALVR